MLLLLNSNGVAILITSVGLTPLTIFEQNNQFNYTLFSKWLSTRLALNAHKG